MPVARRAAFSIEQFRVGTGLAKEEIAFRERGVKVYFGWDSVTRMEIEYEASVARWFHLFSFHQTMEVSSLLEQFRTNKPVFTDAPRTFERSVLTALDVFSLPFRHLT